MNHASEDELDDKLMAVDLLDVKSVKDFCLECYQPLRESKWRTFAFTDFIEALPTTEQYLEAGDYTGAATKFAFGVYVDLLGEGKVDLSPLKDENNPICDLLQQTKIFEDEAPEWITGALAVAVAKCVSHIAVCKEHDISNPTSFFNEIRFIIANSVFKMDEKYLEISGQLGMLIMSTASIRGEGFIEKDPVLTYYTDYILRTWDELPIPATYQGSAMIEALNTAKSKKGESYGLFVSSLFGVTMMAIQLGLVNLESSKVLSTTIANYINTLQENA